MKHIYRVFWLVLWLATPSFAQKGARLYVAEVTTNQSATPKEIKRRNDEITFQAKSQINSMLEVFNNLTLSNQTDFERDIIIKNSYLPNSNQLFYSDGVVIEDDIDPKHTSSDNTAELGVERYLRNMDLFYAKSDSATISFSQIVLSPVQDGKEYPYIKVFFKSTFKGKHSQFDTPYQSVQRVAELRGELVEGKWRAFITRLAFLQPGEALTQLSKPVIAKDFGPKQAIDGKAISFLQTDGSADSVIVKWDTKWLNIMQSSVARVPVGFYQRSTSDNNRQNIVSIALMKADQQLIFRQIDGATLEFKRGVTNDLPEIIKRVHRLRIHGWIQVATGLLALGASYVGYTSLQNDYKQYTGKLSALNNEYAIWQTLTQQPTGSQATPLSFTSYASPGIYAVYGGGGIGGGLLINGVRQLLKAGHLAKKLRPGKKTVQ